MFRSITKRQHLLNETKGSTRLKL